MSPEDALAFRILVSVVLSLGLIYFVLIASTLRKYGEMMDQAWHRRIIGWVNDTAATAYYSAAGSGHIPTTPLPPTSVTVPSKSQPTAELGFDPTLHFYSTKMQYPESKSPTIRSKSVSSSRSIRHGSKFPLQAHEPFADFSSPDLVREHDYGTDNKHDIIASQPVSRNENLSRELKPSPILSPVPAPTPVHPLHLLEAIPDEAYHKTVNNLNLSQEPIKLARLLSLSFEGDHPLDTPPSEGVSKACHMTEELWKELQTVSATFICNTVPFIQP
jgi:hypothetical protein